MAVLAHTRDVAILEAIEEPLTGQPHFQRPERVLQSLLLTPGGLDRFQHPVRSRRLMVENGHGGEWPAMGLSGAPWPQGSAELVGAAA